jgi:hypothetical protein
VEETKQSISSVREHQKAVHHATNQTHTPLVSTRELDFHTLKRSKE